MVASGSRFKESSGKAPAPGVARIQKYSRRVLIPEVERGHDPMVKGHESAGVGVSFEGRLSAIVHQVASQGINKKKTFHAPIVEASESSYPDGDPRQRFRKRCKPPA